MNVLKDIIQRCHEQRGKLLRQRKTVVTGALYKSIPYHFKVHCARGYPVRLDDLEQADISFMPIGHAPENDGGPRDFGGERFLKRQGIGDWLFRQWYASWGIQIYTGIPSARDGAQWHDLLFTYQALCHAPYTVLACIEALVKTTGKPLLTLTKTGGLRFSCRIPEYLHPNIESAKLYTYRHAPTLENPHHRDVYLEILGDKGYSRWDGRYEILHGDLLDPPIISQEVLFTFIDTFRDTLHEPEPPGEIHLETATKVAVAPSSLESKNLNLAKQAFVKRGFSYLRKDSGFHHWVHHNDDSEIHVSLWEDYGIVWVRGITPDFGLPTIATPITDIWKDTGITPPITTPDFPVTDKILAVREGKLSPLALKRSAPVLYQQKPTTKVYGTRKENVAQVQRVFKQDARILGVTAETIQENIESYLLKGGAITLNVQNRSLAEAVEQRYQELKLPSFARWRARMYRAKRMRKLPIDVRMANPFQIGNPCEDPERCRTLERKGGNSRESICPQCPVYTECQERGYLSQPLTLRSAKAQISPTYQLFLDPRRVELLELILEPVDEVERICIVDDSKIELQHLFLESTLPRDTLEAWMVNWRGSALGNFAKALWNALEPQSAPNGSAIARVRAAVWAFQQQEKVIIRQMCQINVRGTVVARGTIDAETGKELAHFTIVFEGGTSAYIPLDANAGDRLKEKGLPFFRLDAFTPNEDINVPMQMAEAIELGVLDAGTIESIQAFPTVNKNSRWTFWHQLKYFFTHYTRDADAPMRWDDKALQFWVPPVLHPRIKRLLLISPTLTKQHLRRVFPDETIGIVRTQPTPWMPGNHVFQLRTDIYSLHTILNRDSNWDFPGLSKMGERFFLGIRAEIDRDPSVKHAIITNKVIIKRLRDITEKDNVCFVTNFKEIDSVDFEEAEVIWIVGTPHWPQSTVWWQAQMLFGNDEEPLYYEGEVELGHYQDKRIQGIYHQNIVTLLTQIVRRAELSRWTNKKVVLLTSIALPNITDRPETHLFDWEDFEVAGGLAKLPEAIATRERFETERDNLTAESRREDVERILGCSARQANRMLQKLRGNIPRVSLEAQILTLLADGEKKASELVAAIGSSSQSVGNELKRLVDIGKIVKVRRGVYALPKGSSF